MIDLGNNKGRATWLQKSCYFLAKSYWQEKEREEAEKDQKKKQKMAQAKRKFR